MEIRALTQEEVTLSLPIWSQAFEHGRRDMSEWLEWEDVKDDRATLYGVWDEDGLQAAVCVIDYRLHLGADVVVPMGGLGGVACLPAKRGRGYAGSGLKYSLEQMRDRGQVTSMLFPFSWDYYRRFGWEWIGVRRRYAIPTRVFRPNSETEHVRLATQADWPAIAAAYAEYAGRYRGALVRPDWKWKGMLEDTKKEYVYTYLYAPNGKVEGYLVYSGGKEEDTSLREVIALNPKAQGALLGFLRRLEMQINKVNWKAPSDDTLWSQYYHWDIETKLQPWTMGRLVDVAGALQAWRPASEARGSVVLALQDECAPWNARTWRVEFANREVSVRSTTETPQITLDIQALSQAYFGTPSVPELRAADRLTVHEEAGYTALRDLLAGPPMWMNDDF